MAAATSEQGMYGERARNVWLANKECTAYIRSFYFSVSTGSKRSPCFLTRARTSSGEKRNASGSPRFQSFSNSAHVSGVEICGLGVARGEYTDTVVLCSSFWLQAVSELFLRGACYNFLMAAGMSAARIGSAE